MTVSLPGPTEHASATRTRGSEEQVVVCSSASTKTGTAPSPCLDVSRQTTVLSCPAVISAMKIHDGNLEIRSDSEYVVRIATSRVRGETQKRNEENADLWNEFENVLKINDQRACDEGPDRPAGNHHSEQGR